MLLRYHIEMLHLALYNVFTPQVLKKIIKANLYQDWLSGQIGHPEYHFDHNAFDKSYAYIEEQRALTISSLRSKDVPSAWSAFGRLTHTAQDFYAHSNYVDLWVAQHSNGTSPDPSTIDPVDPEITNSPALRSGKVYLLEVLTLIPILKPLIMPVLPRDSHGWMNLDAPDRGPNFPYAFQAAIKRTKIEFEKTTKDLSEDIFALFVGKPQM